uniref:Uncharacterized protein n=1 Tax=Kalanchoe fedtschenkoi TaxID=63787 RepID=A0A7N0RCP7_KALFE
MLLPRPHRFTHLHWQRKRMMTASLISTPPWSILHRSISPQSPFSYSTGLLRCTFHPAKPNPTPNPSSSFVTRNNASSSSSAETDTQLLTPDILSRVSAAKDADEALQLIHQTSLPNGLLTTAHCSSIISAAFTRNNPDLALSVYHAMRASFQQQTNNTAVHTWKWSRPDVSTYSLLVRGLAMSLRVPDALKVISDVCRPGVSHGQEVPFGVIVKCPCCMIAVSVAQPQHGSQIVSCFKCRYQYELVSGTIVSIESEAISMDIPAWERGLRFLQIIKGSIPAAVHSIVVQTPSGMARTHRFGTKTVDLPAQEGERVTIALASPSNVYREVGPLKFNAKAPNFYPGEPLCLTNHKNSLESPLLRAPIKDGSASLLSPSLLFPLLAMTATGDAASGIIDPSLPQLISVAVLGFLAVGSTIRFLVVPQLNRLPGRTVEAVAIKQRLLSQYDLLQIRIRELREAVEKEIWMLARMCQLENKIIAVGEPSYRSRRSRIRRVRDSLENSIQGRIELIDNFAKISSMIEIEIEMDTEVLAAEAVSNAERIAEQIQQIMELENLEEKWRIQAEANDEVERLLSSQATLPEQV